jgi:hypothetical protein
LLAAASAVVVAVALSGCGGDPLPRVITDDEADRLSEVFFNNYDNGGARFTLNVLLPDGSTVTMDGEVDFAGDAGLATVMADGVDSPVTEFGWGTDVVVERIPALTELTASTATGRVDYVSRLADPENATLDSLAAVVAALGAEVRENPLLLQQNGVQLERLDTLRDKDVEVYLYGERTRVWVEAGTATLMRFEGNNDSGTRPIIVDLYEPGPRQIALPEGAVVVDMGEVQELYDALRS